jgi:hypothetical protein
MSNGLMRLQPVRQLVITELMTLAKAMSESGFFPEARAQAQAVTKILAGQELGIGPVTSMTGIHVIKGKITLSANLIASAVRRSGKYDYAVRHLDDQRCEIEFYRDGKPIGVSTFTMEDAKRAGLSNGDNWRKYPPNMLFARAMSNGARWYCPDVFNGPVYTPDELGQSVDEESGTVIDVIATPRPMLQMCRKLSEEQCNDLTGLVRAKGANLDKLLAHYGATRIEDLSEKNYEDAVERLRNRPDVADADVCVAVGGNDLIESVTE